MLHLVSRARRGWRETALAACCCLQASEYASERKACMSSSVPRERLCAAHTGARHVVRALGLMSVRLRELLAPGFERLCDEWRVPEVADGRRPSTYLDICPPSLRTEAVPAGHGSSR